MHKLYSVDRKQKNITRSLLVRKFLSKSSEVLDIYKVNEPIKILGIFFTYDQLKSKELNFKVNKKVFKLLAMEKRDTNW